MSSKQGGKAKPLKQPKVDKKEYDEGMTRVRQALELVNKFNQNNLTAEENSRQARAADHRVKQLMKFIKLSPPAFSGSSDPVEAYEWIISLEQIFHLLECSDEQKVSYAIFMLRGPAYNYWMMIRCNADVDEQLTWVGFTELFYQRYFPESAWRQKEEEFINLAQGSMSVAQYYNKFNDLVRFVKNIILDESRMARMFQQGLRWNIRSFISPLLLKTCTDVLDRALRVESVDEEVQRRKRPRVEGDRACFKCGMNDHFVRECPLQNDRRESALLTWHEVQTSDFKEID